MTGKSHIINVTWAGLMERLRNNYWLLPTVMAVLSVVLAVLTLHLDRSHGYGEWLAGWIYQGGADGARSLLGSLAGATLTIAGVIFSMNLVSLTMASQQFGPRLLYNFVRDLGSQFTLGIFTAIFIFCILVLREIHGSSVEPGDVFIPHLSVTTAAALALAGMGVLIYYVHHVAVHIQAPVIVANVGRQLEETIREEFHVRLQPGQGRTDYPGLMRQYPAVDFSWDSQEVNSPASGYIQMINFARLLVLARRYDLKLKLLQRPGDFAIEGTPLMQVIAAGPLSAGLRRELTRVYRFGRRRTYTQDIEFAVNELCEVAIRAMSPAINDPFTCIACIDWLSAAMEELFQRDTPPGFLADGENVLRIVWHPVTHEGVMDSAFNQVRQFGVNCPAVIMRLLESYNRIAGHIRTDAEREIVRKHAEMAMRAAQEHWSEPNDVADAEERFRKVKATLAAGGEI